MPNLSFSKPHLSITEFPSIELPALTVITGVNGAGKTHLMRAIENGAIRCDAADAPSQDVRFLDWSMLKPGNERRLSVTDCSSVRDEMLACLRDVGAQVEVRGSSLGSGQ